MNFLRVKIKSKSNNDLIKSYYGKNYYIVHNNYLKIYL